ncbi:mechanosensitive ion channel family protein, partial [Enterococcus faecium]
MLEQSISYLTKNQDLIIAFGLKLLVAIVIFYIGRWVALGASQLVS